MYFPLKQYLFTRQKAFLVVLCLLSGVSVSLPSPARADEVTHLYEATIPVQSQDKEERKQAIQSAFVQVLIRVSGRLDVADPQAFPDVAQATQSATRYAQQFRYVKVDTAATVATAGTTPETTSVPPPSGLALWVRFDETAISHLLRANHLPVWGMTRPTTLVWLAVDQRGKRELLGSDSRNETYDILTAEATLRGVPLRLPLLDLTDRTSINASDVWGNFGNTILQASQRYQTEAVLVGRVYQLNANSWSGRWTLYVDSGSENWTVNGASLADVVNAGVDNTAQSLAMRYGQVDQADTSSVVVEVKQIKGLADYNRVVKYLNTISHVKNVQPVELAASSAIFRLKIPGGRLAVARAVSLGQTLAADESDTTPMESLPQETGAPVSSTANTPVSTIGMSSTTSAPAGNTSPATSGAASNTSAPASGVNTPASPAPRDLIPDLVYRLVP